MPVSVDHILLLLPKAHVSKGTKLEQDSNYSVCENNLINRMQSKEGRCKVRKEAKHNRKAKTRLAKLAQPAGFADWRFLLSVQEWCQSTHHTLQHGI